MLHLHMARKMLETHQPVNICFWKRNGEIVRADNVVCTSSYFRGNTFNIKFLESEEFRKIKAVLIFNINGEEVYV